MPPHKSEDDIIKLLEEFKSSALNAAQFCRRKKLNRRTFYSWINRLQDAMGYYVEDKTIEVQPAPEAEPEVEPEPPVLTDPEEWLDAVVVRQMPNPRITRIMLLGSRRVGYLRHKRWAGKFLTKNKHLKVKPLPDMEDVYISDRL